MAISAAVFAVPVKNLICIPAAAILAACLLLAYASGRTGTEKMLQMGRNSVKIKNEKNERK
ncbi:hypothetical protein [[Clostridium] aminophilum]|uniref:hypothetical protein n=1 Tax=[Clostridium] aminophilum TaxID=1526 RepID=UPI003317CC1A